MKKPKKSVTVKPEYDADGSGDFRSREACRATSRGAEGSRHERQERVDACPTILTWRSAPRLLGEAVGTADQDFLNGLLCPAFQASAPGREGGERTLNFLLSIVKGVKPRDEIEAMLAAEMATVHLAIMTFARRLNHVETIQQQDSAERALSKLARTFATHMEAMKRLRAIVPAVSKGDRAACVGQRRRSGDRRQRHAGAARKRAGEGCAGGIDTFTGRTDADLRQERRARSRAASAEEMSHPRNTGPMLSSRRCGAKTRSGKPCSRRPSR